MEEIIPIQIPETMLAAVLDEYGGPLIVRRIPTPKPGPGEVLVRMAAAPINPSDLGFMTGSSSTSKPVPVVPGNEGSGRVVAGGPGLLPRLWRGRRVACAVSGRHNGCWAEYMVTGASHCIPLQGSVRLERAAMMLVNPMTVLAFFELARKGKHKALVNTAAASNLGRMVLRLGKARRVPVIHIVRRAEQVELLRAMGVELVLNSSEPDFDDQLKELAHRHGASLLLDAIGGEMTARLLAAAPPGSTVLCYGLLSQRTICFHPRLLYDAHTRLEGFYLGTWQTRQNTLKVMLAAIQAQRLINDELQPVVQKKLPLQQAAQGVELYQSHMTAGKVLLVIDEQEVALD